MSYFEIFKREIIRHSNADNYFDACHEWDEVCIDVADDDEECYCICSHPIKQLITIRNRENGNDVVVGSDCIRKIPNFPNASLYQPVISNLADLKKNPDGFFLNGGSIRESGIDSDQGDGRDNADQSLWALEDNDGDGPSGWLSRLRNGLHHSSLLQCGGSFNRFQYRRRSPA